MPVVIIGKTAVAARLLRYTEKEKAGGVEPRVLYSEGIRCRVPTAEAEFATVRRQHGKQGAKRKAPARYELPNPGEIATLVRRARPNGRKYWAVASDSRTATHVRREGEGYVDELQAVHVIVSYGLAEVNPDDPDQVWRAFEFVATMMSALYPGIQMKLVGQADGEGKAFHVHCVQNAVIVERMEVDGMVWEAGRKMSGALTDINRLRERVDEFIGERGSEFGVEQKLPSVTEQKEERRSVRDRRMAARGEVSNHDIVRVAFEESMDDARAIDVDGFIQVMAEHGVAVNYRVTRAGKPNEKHSLSYRLSDMSTPVRGTTLGDHYAYERTLQQLQANAAGLQRARRPELHRSGAAKPRLAPSTKELDDAQAIVERLAREHRAAAREQQLEDDYRPALLEDFDAANEAHRTGNYDEMTRLANATRDKESQSPPKRAATHATSLPDDDSPDSPDIAAKPQQPIHAVKREPTWKERVQAALAEVHAESQAGTDRMIAEYLRDKEAEKAYDLSQRASQAEAAARSQPGIAAATQREESPTEVQTHDSDTSEVTPDAHEPGYAVETPAEAKPISKPPASREAPSASPQGKDPHFSAAIKRLERQARLRAALTPYEATAEGSPEDPTLGI